MKDKTVIKTTVKYPGIFKKLFHTYEDHLEYQSLEPKDVRFSDLYVGWYLVSISIKHIVIHQA